MWIEEFYQKRGSTCKDVGRDLVLREIPPETIGLLGAWFSERRYVDTPPPTSNT